MRTVYLIDSVQSLLFDLRLLTSTGCTLEELTALAEQAKCRIEAIEKQTKHMVEQVAVMEKKWRRKRVG